MSPELLGWFIGPAAGSLVGAFSGSVCAVWWQSQKSIKSVSPENNGEPGQDPQLSEADRAAMEAAFQTHASAVARQVRAFADELASGDVVLRERLRRLELPEDGRR